MHPILYWLNVRMQIGDLNILFGEHPEIRAIGERLGIRGDKHLLLSGLHASARALALAHIRKPMFVIFDNAESAQYAYSDLKSLGTNVGFFPAAKRRRTIDDAAVIQRTECLTALTSKGMNELTNERLIVVTYPEAVAESVPAKEELKAVSFQLSVGQEIRISDLGSQISNLGFERVDFVFQPGQYAVRGSIVDIYSYSHDTPYRLDFFGDEIDSIREFDIEDQLSKNRVDSAEIVGSSNDANGGNDANDASIVDYLTEEYVWVSNDWTIVQFKLDGLGVLGDLGDLGQRRTIEIAEKSTFPEYTKIEFEIVPQPVFHKQFDILTEDLKRHIDDGYKIYILAEQQKQLDRLAAIFESLEDGSASLQDANATGVRFIPIQATLHEGFVDKGLKICCYTDHQIFERYHRVTMASENARRGKAIITLREINQLQIGDYVVHSDHGIAKFGGLVTTPVNGKPQEMIKLIYRDGANVFVSIHNLHRISKYKGREGSEPTIARLGSGAWERLKERTKDKVKDIARDLIRLYATRKQQKGYAYSPDGYMQHELEASFLYEDTPDQAKERQTVSK